MGSGGAMDVAVIGGGLMGWSVAYRLARAGIGVAVVDRGDAGYATAAGAGIIAPGTSLRPLPAFFPLAKAAVAYYPRLTAELAEDGETGTGYEACGALFIARDEGEAARLPELLRLMEERRAGGMGALGAMTLLDAAGARALYPPLAEVPVAIQIAEAARVDGRALRDALRRAAVGRGAVALTGDAVPVRRGERVVGVAVDGEMHTAGAVVIAGGAWSSALGEALGVALPVEPQRGQIVHLALPGVETGGWPIVEGFYDQYQVAFRPNRVVVGATRETSSGYDVRQTAGGLHHVLSFALSVAPGLAEATIAEVRVGLRPLSPDGLPVIGRAPGLANVYLCTGHGPSGLQLGPFSGAAVAALIAGEAPGANLAPFAAERFG